MEEQKDVLITIRSSQMLEGGEDDGAELVTEGKYRFSGNGIRLSYQETELTGLEGTRTVFRVRPDEVILRREGAVNSEMVFRPGEQSSFAYETEFGVLQMGLDTRWLELRLDEHGGELEIVYDLDFERSFVSRNTFKISVKERERGLKS